MRRLEFDEENAHLTAPDETKESWSPSFWCRLSALFLVFCAWLFFLAYVATSPRGEISSAPPPTLNPVALSHSQTMNPTSYSPTTTQFPTSPSPTTQFPTSSNSPSTTPISTIEDDLLQSTDYSIDQSIQTMWTSFRADKLSHNFADNQSAFNEFCQASIAKYPQLHRGDKRYPFSFPRLTSLKNTNAFINHVLRLQFALANHYQLTSLTDLHTAFVFNEASLDRTATTLFHRLSSESTPTINFGFMGTSVMSGQDNCYENSLAPLLGRKLRQLFGNGLVSIGIRNQGQNGDSPDQTIQLLCAESIMGKSDLDFLHVWYPMMPQSALSFKEFFIRNWYADQKNSRLGQVTFFPDSSFEGFDLFESEGFMTKILWHPDFSPQFQGLSPRVWGGIGDGFCRMRTREDVTGVVKQNWHFGPMGFELLSDGMIAMYSTALLRALQWKRSLLPLPDLPLLPSPMRNPLVDVECTNKCRNKQCYVNLNQTYSPYAFACDPTPTVYKPVVCLSGNHPQFQHPNLAELKQVWQATSVTSNSSFSSSLWVFTQTKVLSSIHVAFEQKVENYRNRPECGNFLDDGFSFVTHADRETDWLDFTVPAGFSNLGPRILLCTGTRYPNPGYGETRLKEPGPDWKIRFRVNRVLQKSDVGLAFSRIFPACVIVWDNDQEKAPLLLEPGFVFGFQFVFPFGQDEAARKITVGNVLFL